jgi:hypothetical protein
MNKTINNCFCLEQLNNKSMHIFNIQLKVNFYINL